MAYSTNNRPYLIVPAVAGGFGNFSTSVSGQVGGGSSDVGGNVWAYRSSDALATVGGANYFTDGFKLGLRKGDIMFITQFSTLAAVSALGLAAVSSVGVSSAASVTVSVSTF